MTFQAGTSESPRADVGGIPVPAGDVSNIVLQHRDHDEHREIITTPHIIRYVTAPPRASTWPPTVDLPRTTLDRTAARSTNFTRPFDMRAFRPVVQQQQLARERQRRREVGADVVRRIGGTGRNDGSGGDEAWRKPSRSMSWQTAVDQRPFPAAGARRLVGGKQ